LGFANKKILSYILNKKIVKSSNCTSLALSKMYSIK